MNNKKFNVGIVGCGTIAPYHVEAFQTLENVEVVGVSDVNEMKAKELCSKYNINFWTTDYRKLHDLELDVISICVPSGLHYEVSIDAMKKKKHVIVEKPLAINLKQADEMILTSEKERVKLATIFDHRFDLPSRMIKDALNKDLFGKLILVDAHIKWYRTQDYYANGWRGTWNLDGGGILANQAIHWLDLIQWFAGPLKSVYGKIKTFTHEIEAADTAVAILEFFNGSLGVIEASTSIYPGRQKGGFVYNNLPESIGIYGEKGSVVVEGSKNIKLWEFAENGSSELIKENKIKNVTSSHKELIKAIIDSLREDKDVPIDGKEGRKSLELMRAIYYSSFINKKVDFPFLKDDELEKIIEDKIK
jgi:UDP-N-acetyl-2-amino-2-deoxyglucuronate dehydrogenase